MWMWRKGIFDRGKMNSKMGVNVQSLFRSNAQNLITARNTHTQKNTTFNPLRAIYRVYTHTYDRKWMAYELTKISLILRPFSFVDYALREHIYKPFLPQCLNAMHFHEVRPHLLVLLSFRYAIAGLRCAVLCSFWLGSYRFGWCVCVCALFSSFSWYDFLPTESQHYYYHYSN